MFFCEIKAPMTSNKKYKGFLKVLCFIGLLIFTGNISHCQSVVSISGSVFDKATGEVLPYAHISIKGRSVGTVTNEAGQFTFHIPQNFFNTDSLLISFVGYESITQSVSGIVSNKIEQFKLSPKTTMLNAVTVSDEKITAKSVIVKAIERIPENYTSEAHVLQGFFRDWKMVEFTNAAENKSLLLEAAVNIYNPPANSKAKKTNTYIKEIRRGDLPERGWNYFNSLTDLLNKNYIKNNKATDFSLPEAVLTFPNQYTFKFDGEEKDDEYLIIQATTADSKMVYKFFVKKDDFAIEQIDLINNEPFIRSDWRIKFISNTLRFKKWNDKWFLSYSKRNWRIENFDTKTGATIRKEEYYVELLINNIALVQDSMPRELGFLMSRKKPLEFQALRYDSVFWNNYNVIEYDSLNHKVKTFLSGKG